MKLRIIKRGKYFVVQQESIIIVWSWWSDILNISGFTREYDTLDEAEETVKRIQQQHNRVEVIVKEYNL